MEIEKGISSSDQRVQALQTTIVELESEGQRELQEQRASYEEKIQDLSAEQATAIEAMSNSYTQQVELLQTSNEAFEKQLETLEAARESQVAELTSRLEQQRDERAAERDALTLELTTSFEAQLAERDAKNADQIANVQSSYEQRIDEIRTDTTARITELTSSFERRLAEVNTRNAAHVADLTSSYEQQIADAKSATMQQLHELHSSSHGQIEALKLENQSLLERVGQTDGYADQIHELAAERDDLATQLSATRNQIAQFDSKLEGMQTEISTHHEEIRSITTEKQELLNGLHREQEERLRLESLLETMEGRASDYETAHDEATRLRDQCRELERRLEVSDSLASKFELERDGINASLIHAQRRVDELSGSVTRFEQDVASRESLIRKLRHEKDNIGTQLEMERRERNRLEEMLRVHVETLEQLRVDSQSLESLLERQTIVQQSLQEHAENLRTVAGVNSHHADDYQAPEDPPILSMSVSSESEPVARDDLKKISGIGEVLEQKLYALGVTNYQQIASWVDSDVEEFSRSLQWDRIEADEWIIQAGRLLEDLVRSRLKAA